MLNKQIRLLILARVNLRTIDAILDSITDVCPELYESDIKAVILGMVRRNEIELDENFNIRRVTPLH